MDQNIALLELSRFRHALDDMCDSDRSLSILHLCGFAQTLYLIEFENTAEPGRHDLDIGAIAGVSRGWADHEGDSWAGGFVIDLRDGRRVYAESYADGVEWGPDSYVLVMPMAANADMPDLAANHVSCLYGWRQELRELGEYLQRVQR